MNRDVLMVDALLEFLANFTIKNKEDMSAAVLIHQNSNFRDSKITKV